MPMNEAPSNNDMYSPEFKAAVALAAMRGEQTAEELAERFGIDNELVEQWERELQAGVAGIFAPAESGADRFAATAGSDTLARTITENMTLALAMMDARGKCVYANRAWRRMAGYGEEELRASTLHELIHPCHPDGRPWAAEEFASGRVKPEPTDTDTHDGLFFRKDGSCFPVLYAVTPFMEGEQALGTIIEVRDVLEGKRTADRQRRAAATAIAAAEANAKFRAFFDQGSYFAGVMTIDGTLVEANRLCLDACGYSREDVIGKKFWDCGWWNRCPELVEMVREGSRLAAAGQRFQKQTKYFISDGGERVTDLVLAPVTDDAGKVLFIAPTGVDITERHGVEERLRMLDAMSQATREASDPKAIMEAMTRLLGEHLRTTRCAYADLEPDNNRFTIRHDWRAPGAISTVGVYSLDLFGTRAASDMRAGRTLVIRDVDQELDAANGAAMFSAIGVKAIICCPLVKGGRLVAMMAVHQDRPRQWDANDIALVEEVVDRSWAHIERVRTTEILRRNEAHLSSLFEQTGAGIGECDLRGHIVSANERLCSILGRTKEQVIGCDMRSLVHPDDLGRNLELYEHMLRTGQPFELEKRYVRPDGSTIWVSTTVSLIRAGGGKPAETVLAVVIDIAERKRAEEKLREADRRKDEFLAMLAHELRNPLAPIGAAADLLRMANLANSQVKQTSEIIARQVKHMSSLVDDLLDVSRVTRGLVVLDKTELDVRRIVSDAVEQVRPYIESRRHNLEVHTPPESALVHVDKKRIVQVMANLLNNAAKYTPEGGRIVLAIETRDREVVMSVADTGVGMSQELVSRAFDLFTQAERPADRSQGGLGIGLALVKSLVELHDGTVSASSDGVGKGSKFVVRLPRLDTASRDSGPGSDVHSAANGKTGLNILVVDDNEDAADMLAMFLDTLGHRVVVEHESHAALERARKEAFDVCLLDIGLPLMDGNMLAQRLREHPATAHAVLVAVSGYGQEHDKKKSFASGFNFHFVKPVDISKLAKLLADLSTGEARGGVTRTHPV